MPISPEYLKLFINSTEKAAYGAYLHLGNGDKIAADKGAVDAMRQEGEDESGGLQRINFSFTSTVTREPCFNSAERAATRYRRQDGTSQHSSCSGVCCSHLLLRSWVRAFSELHVCAVVAALESECQLRQRIAVHMCKSN